ncbi:MAG: SpoIVB peptidase S55 domain-containing protein [Veillonellaceae bacterium]|nr:SpoIVB peptidase S55 domain-containing protein [Veillonellaceae bacterium]
MNRYIGKIKKGLVSLCLTGALLVSSVAVAALPEIIGLKELQPGMWGTGYTVIDASGEIRPFDVQVVGILGDNSKMSAKRILVNLSGPLIEETGGAISGMSGSPIYFNGRLAGALSAGYTDMYPTQRIMLTPIEDMLKIWDYPDTRNKTRMPQLDLAQMKAEREKFQADQEAKAKEGKEPAEEKAAEEAAAQSEEHEEQAGAEAQDEETATDEEAEVESGSEAPLEHKTTYFASGFGAQGLKMLQSKMSPLGIQVDYDNTWDNGVSMMSVRPNAVLQPGSSVGVAMSIGDFTFGSMGTVTAVDGNRVLAFGHSYTHRGNVNYFMTDADVISTIHGPTSGMKLGNVQGIIGRVNQDRQDGIGGILGQFPQTVPVIVTVHDKDTGREITYNTMVAYDEEVLAALAPVVVYSSINTTLDRQDASTASLQFSLRSSYGKDGLISRRNMFYDGGDVAKVAVTELNDILAVILGNKEKEADMLDLKVDVTIDKGRKTATLVSAVPSKQEVVPGEEITFDTTIKPYRGEKIKLSVPYKVPEHQQPGQLALDVHGGGLVNVAKILLAQQQATEAGAKPAEEEPTVDVQLQNMLSSNCNNDIVIESTVVVPQNDAELKESIRQAQKLAKELAKNPQAVKKPNQKPVVYKLATDYIIENVIHTSVKVLEKK